jgi:hypothetical protein
VVEEVEVDLIDLRLEVALALEALVGVRLKVLEDIQDLDKVQQQEVHLLLQHPPDQDSIILKQVRECQDSALWWQLELLLEQEVQ